MRWSGTTQGTSETREHDVVVNVPSKAILLGDLNARMKARVGFTVATLNLDHITKLRSLPDFREAYMHHSHVTADGNPIVWFSRLAGQNISLVPGSELIEPTIELAVHNDVPVAFLGSTPASLETASQVLQDRYPGLIIAATISPPMGFDPAASEALECVNKLKESGARLVFVALGAPKQEIFAARAATSLPEVGFLSIGAGLDFISGTQVRAPRVVRIVAAEWLWRLARNPQRLARRYGACIAVMPSLFKAALNVRFGHKAASADDV